MITSVTTSIFAGEIWSILLSSSSSSCHQHQRRTGAFLHHPGLVVTLLYFLWPWSTPLYNIKQCTDWLNDITFGQICSTGPWFIAHCNGPVLHAANRNFSSSVSQTMAALPPWLYTRCRTDWPSSVFNKKGEWYNYDLTIKMSNLVPLLFGFYTEHSLHNSGPL